MPTIVFAAAAAREYFLEKKPFMPVFLATDWREWRGVCACFVREYVFVHPRACICVRVCACMHVEVSIGRRRRGVEELGGGPGVQMGVWAERVCVMRVAQRKPCGSCGPPSAGTPRALASDVAKQLVDLGPETRHHCGDHSGSPPRLHPCRLCAGPPPQSSAGRARYA